MDISVKEKRAQVWGGMLKPLSFAVLAISLAACATDYRSPSGADADAHIISNPAAWFGKHAEFAVGLVAGDEQIQSGEYATYGGLTWDTEPYDRSIPVHSLGPSRDFVLGSTCLYYVAATSGPVTPFNLIVVDGRPHCLPLLTFGRARLSGIVTNVRDVEICSDGANVTMKALVLASTRIIDPDAGRYWQADCQGYKNFNVAAGPSSV